MAKMRTLIVEDEAVIRLNIKMILSKINCETIGETSNGEDAVALAKELKPDVICMDIKLHGKMNGIEAAEKISEFSETPFLFMSAFNHDDNKIDRDKIKKSAFLVKPIQKRQIELALKKIL